MGSGVGCGNVAIKRFATVSAMTMATVVSSPACAAEALSFADLDRLPIEDLAKIEISSVSKTAQPLSDAPAAVYVITHEDVVRSGAISLPEILRLAPNLQVAQTSASQYVITARGFSGNPGDQSFSNKLLVLIDGRSVYTPLYSGVYWDMQDVVPDDIDRIEVISGPGATLWGANAVNGVINIITRKSGETQGGVVNIEAGSFGGGASLRYGGKINDDLTYRLYLKDFVAVDTATAAGANAHDHGSKPQGGLRFDWTPTNSDTVTVQGDDYQGVEGQYQAPDESITGRNLLARWSHSGQDGSVFQLQGYYDRTERLTDQNGGHYGLDTYDLDAQDSLTLGRRNAIVWGGGVRVDQYKITGTTALQFSPRRRTLVLANVFAQDTVSISDAAKLIVGLKLEGDPYSGTAVLPNVRMSWKPTGGALLWAAASQAIRSPTPFDRDLVEKIGTMTFLTGDASFRSEKLTAYEIGARVQPASALSFSVSAFYNLYQDLRSLEIDPDPVTLLPLRWGNRMRGATSGLEAWGDYRVAPWWRLSASFNFLSEHLKFEQGSAHLIFGGVIPGAEQVGDDPKEQASLRSAMNLSHGVTLDADLRYVSPLPDPPVPSYVELDGRLGWTLSPRVQLSLSGFNLLNDHHLEFPGADPVQRSFVVGLQWRF